MTATAAPARRRPENHKMTKRIAPRAGATRATPGKTGSTPRRAPPPETTKSPPFPPGRPGVELFGPRCITLSGWGGRWSVAGAARGARRRRAGRGERCMTVDAGTIAAVRAGDADAFEAIVAEFQPRLYRFLYGLVGDAELARDLTQDTFLAAYRALPATGPNLNLTGWLFQIARNHARSHWRRRKLFAWVPFLGGHGSPEEEDRPWRYRGRRGRSSSGNCSARPCAAWATPTASACSSAPTASATARSCRSPA